jgi:hypothetical protein
MVSGKTAHSRLLRQLAFFSRSFEKESRDTFLPNVPSSVEPWVKKRKENFFIMASLAP